MKIRSYSELRRLQTFDERFDYLAMRATVGAATFGFDRHINQEFYTSNEWRRARRDVIVRDQGCDLGVPGYEIGADILVHHMNPMSVDDILHGEEWIINPEYLITTTVDTHNAIHFGNRDRLRQPFVERAPGDTRLW